MRAYYDDSYTYTFTARVTESLEVDGRPAVVLDKTYFYPTGGGQPHDTGQIATTSVLDVQSRKSDNTVLHILSEPLAEGEYACIVDGARRFDHMQHHTGQHILSQAFVQVASANTVGFHLSPDSVTIDLDHIDLSERTIAAAEDLANRIIFENRPVTAKIIDPSKAEGIRMRRVPEALATGGLRVVDIQDFDQTACGGTHVARTGEIGIVKIIKVEKRGDKLRIEFRCGGRALLDYRERARVTALLGADLTCPIAEMPDAVAKLRDELKAVQRALKSAHHDLIAYESTSLLAASEIASGVRWVIAAFPDRDGAALRLLANALIQESGIVALLGSYGARSQIVLARSADLSFDMASVFRALTAEFPDVRGGGQPNLAQGGGAESSPERLDQLLAFARLRIHV